MREITITANGRNYPQVPYNLDYEGNRYVRAFHDFHEFIGHSYTTESCGIDYQMYKGGWCFYAFSLSNSMENENCFELIKDGVTAVHLKFNEPIPGGGITMIAYAECDALLLIDKFRQITSDLTV